MRTLGQLSWDGAEAASSPSAPQPARLLAISIRRRARVEAGAWLLLAAALAAAPLVVNAYGILLGYLFFQYLALGQAWNLQAGYAGLVSLGSGAFVGLGEYAATKSLLASGGMSPVLLILFGGVAAGLLALVTSFPLFRLRGIYFAIGTLAVAETLLLWLSNWGGMGGGGGLVLPGSGPSMLEVYYLSGAIAAVMMLTVIWLPRTSFGIRLRAVRDNQDVAEEMGVGTFGAKLVAFVLGSAVMGLVGGLQALYLGSIEPTSAFGINWTNDILVVVLVGGLATKSGPLLGALIAVLLQQELAGFPSAHFVIEGVLLVIVIRLLPGGLIGELTSSRVRKSVVALARLAGRRRVVPEAAGDHA